MLVNLYTRRQVNVLGAELLEQAVAGDSDSVHPFNGN